MTDYCVNCGSIGKSLPDLFRLFENQVIEIFWCEFCGALWDANAMDTYVHRPLIHKPKEAREFLKEKGI